MTNSLERALALLELLEHAPGGLRNAGISRELKIPRSTCSYIAARLEQKGYLSRAHTTALGKVLLAFLPAQQRVELLRDLALARRTSKTIVSKAKLTAELAEVRRQGYAEADEENITA